MAPMPGSVSSVWTHRLQLLTFTCSFVFAICTILQGWMVINPETVELSLRLAGRTAAETAAEAPGLLTECRMVAAYYLAGNALGMFALRGSAWSFWAALVVNLTQAGSPLGLIPAGVYRAALQSYGPVGLFPTVVIGGGAIVLIIALISGIVPFREIWADIRAAHTNG